MLEYELIWVYSWGWK